MDITKLSKQVLGDVRQNLGCEEPTDESKDGQIAMMTPVEVFDCYLIWNGIIGYSRTLWDAVENIKAAAKKEGGV